MTAEIDETKLAVSPTGVGVSLYAARIETREDVHEWRGPVPPEVWITESLLASAADDEDRRRMRRQATGE